MGKKFRETHTIPFYECDAKRRLTIPTLIKLAVSCSTVQSEQLGVSEEDVEKLGLGWIITHYEITISRLPEQGETVTVQTEAESYNKFFCYRNFWIFDESGAECVFIESVFALMDFETRKIASVRDEVLAPFESEKIKKIKRPTPLLPFEKATESKDYRVRFYDLDANQHVNNAVYFSWLFDVLDRSFLEEHVPEKIVLNFNKEVRYGEMVVSEYELVEEVEFLATKHQVHSQDQLSCEATIYWQR